MADLFMRPNELQPAHASAEGTLAAPDHDGSLVSPRRGDVLSSVVQTADAANILAVYAASEVIVAHELERVEADLAWREAAIAHLTKEREQLLEHKKAKQLQQSTLEKTTQSFKDMTQVMAPTHEDRPVVKHQHEARIGLKALVLLQLRHIVAAYKCCSICTDTNDTSLHYGFCAHMPCCIGQVVCQCSTTGNHLAGAYCTC